MSNQDRSLSAALARAGLSCLAWPYRAVIASRNACYSYRLCRAIDLGRPTVSVGNITTGGTGKTPMVIELANRLHRQGKRPAVLLRGYKAADTNHSDEATLLAESLGDTAVVEPGADRVAAAKRVLANDPNIDVFLLDDGFQHRRVKRNLDLVLIDATQPFGHGRLLPRGLLREPLTALRRANAVMITRADLISPDQLAKLDQRIEQLTGRPPTAHTAQRWSRFVDLQGNTAELPALSHTRVVSACGIGNPDAFERTLHKHTGDVTHAHRFEDHHHYTRADLDAIFQRAKDHAAAAVVTTHKDAVKWRPLLADGPPPVPVYYPAMGVAFLDGEQNVDTLLRETLASG